MQDEHTDLFSLPRNTPPGLVWAGAENNSVETGHWKQIAYYEDGHGELAATRVYERIQNKHGLFVEEKWFDANGNRHRDSGPAHIEVYWAAPRENEEDRAWAKWYKKGQTVRYVNLILDDEFDICPVDGVSFTPIGYEEDPFDKGLDTHDDIGKPDASSVKTTADGVPMTSSA